MNLENRIVLWLAWNYYIVFVPACKPDKHCKKINNSDKMGVGNSWYVAHIAWTTKLSCYIPSSHEWLYCVLQGYSRPQTSFLNLCKWQPDMYNLLGLRDRSDHASFWTVLIPTSLLLLNWLVTRWGKSPTVSFSPWSCGSRFL